MIFGNSWPLSQNSIATLIGKHEFPKDAQSNYLHRAHMCALSTIYFDNQIPHRNEEMTYGSDVSSSL